MPKNVRSAQLGSLLDKEKKERPRKRYLNGYYKYIFVCIYICSFFLLKVGKQNMDETPRSNRSECFTYYY